MTRALNPSRCAGFVCAWLLFSSIAGAQFTLINPDWVNSYPASEPYAIVRGILWVDDIDGDGCADFCGAMFEEVVTFSGADGSYISTPSPVSSAGVHTNTFKIQLTDDWTGDGIRELLVQRFDPLSVFSILPDISIDVVDLVTGTIIQSVAIPAPADVSGATILLTVFDELDDLDGDGRRELLIGSAATGGGQGALVIMSPVTSFVFGHWFGGGGGRGLGATVLSIEDFDGDGLKDFVARAAYEIGHVGPVAGTAEIWGSNGGYHFSVDVLPIGGGAMGSTFGQFNDFDGDGAKDFVHNEVNNTIVVRSSVTAQPLAVLSAPVCLGVNFTTAFATDFCSDADWDGDGVTDLIVGDRAANLGFAASTGAILFYSGADLSFIGVDYGIGNGARLGEFISVADADGDGFADVITSMGVGPGLFPAYLQRHLGRPAFDASYRDGTVRDVLGIPGLDVLGVTAVGAFAPDYGGIDRTVEISSSVLSSVWLARCKHPRILRLPASRYLRPLLAFK